MKKQDGKVASNNDGKVKMEINQVKVAICNESVKSYVEKEESLESTLTRLYHVTWGQCSKLPKYKLKGQKAFLTIESEQRYIRFTEGDLKHK